MRHALVFGGSGQIGRPVIDRLRRTGWRITAVSREPRNDMPSVQWLRGDFAAMPALPGDVDAIVSCGPLDHFAQWYRDARVASPCVVAFGSTSIDTKRGSADPYERDLARRLREGEDAVFSIAHVRGARAAVLRPTLVYGAGRDATLTRIAQLARQWRRFVLPRRAIGLRQPVHVDDLADAALACIGREASAGLAYALGGGETLPYREMVARMLASLDPPISVTEVPGPVFQLALLAAQATGRMAGLGESAVARMREDLVFDLGPARRDLDYAPRLFRPTAAMFDPHGINRDLD